VCVCVACVACVCGVCVRVCVADGIRHSPPQAVSARELSAERLQALSANRTAAVESQSEAVGKVKHYNMWTTGGQFYAVWEYWANEPP
jgi:ferredoxin